MSADPYNGGFYVRATTGEALDWARGQGLTLPDTGKIRAINEARTDQGLPVFVTGTLPVPHEEAGSEAAPIAAPETPASVMKRTSAGLRDILFHELEDLRAGRSDPRRAMATAALAKTIVDSVRMELEFMRQTDGKPPELPTIELVKP